ncbi:MAG: hypothetical protein Q7T14_00735, partial [Aestuariivirga sp.]|nr:hypothetical protein [Aestuariivirga sp.]
MAPTPSKVDIASGLNTLTELLQKLPTDSDWNEAQTRYKFIDLLIEQCLGWDRQAEVEVEHSFDNSYADYVLGQPQALVIEAKREGIHFELPANSTGKLKQSLASLMALSAPLKKAITQVQQYCAQRGVVYAAICNGTQLIAFVGVKIGAAPLNGNALV